MLVVLTSPAFMDRCVQVGRMLSTLAMPICCRCVYEGSGFRRLQSIPPGTTRILLRALLSYIRQASYLSLHMVCTCMTYLLAARRSSFYAKLVRGRGGGGRGVHRVLIHKFVGLRRIVGHTMTIGL